MKRRLGFVLFLVAGAWDPVTSKNRDVEEGNKSFAGGKYEDAERRYRAAQKKVGNDPALHFDLGAALSGQAEAMAPGQAREGIFDAAEKELRLALDATDPRLRAGAHYNLGNTFFHRGKYLEAIDEYKKSLKLDPARDDARHNLELALRRKQEPPPQQQPQPKPDDQKNQQQDQQQPQPQPDQPQPQSEPQPEAQPPPEQGDEQKPEQQAQPQPAPDEAQDKGAKPVPSDLTKEDIERKLDELEDASKRLQAGRARERSAERRRGKPVKDW